MATSYPEMEIPVPADCDPELRGGWMMSNTMLTLINKHRHHFVSGYFSTAHEPNHALYKDGEVSSLVYDLGRAFGMVVDQHMRP